MISINLWEISFQIINFTILLWLINKFLVIPMNTFLDKRANSIKDDIETAEENLRKSEDLVKENKELLKQARLEAKQIRETTENASKNDRVQMLTQAKEESKRVLEQAQKEIGLSVSRAKKELLSEIGDLSVMLSERILSRTISENDKQTFVKESLKKLPLS